MKIITRILLILISVLLTVLLTVTTLTSSLISCVRAQFTPGFIYNYMNSIDYASLELPDGNGNIATVCDIMNNQVRDFGIYFTEDDINSLVQMFSIDAILTSYVQDVRTWALNDGPVPTLNAKEAADTVMHGLDNSLYAFLSMFGDPSQTLASAIEGIAAAADLSALFEKAELIQKVLAFDAMFFVISISVSVFLLILIANRLKLVPTAVYTGLACIVTGSVMIVSRQIAAPYKAQLFSSPDMLPESLFDTLYNPFMATVHRTGVVIALGGLAAIVVFTVIGTFSAMIAREKAANRAYADKRMNGFPPAAFDYMQGGFEAANPTLPEEPVQNETTPAENESAPEENEENHNDTDY